MSCHQCQTYSKIKTQAQELIPVKVNEPLELVGMDLIIYIKLYITKILISFYKDRYQQLQKGINMFVPSLIILQSLWIFTCSKRNLQMVLQNASKHLHAGNMREHGNEVDRIVIIIFRGIIT